MLCKIQHSLKNKQIWTNEISLFVSPDINQLSIFQAEQQKQAAIITAEGDAEGAHLLSDAFKAAGNGLIELRKIEASEEIAVNLSRNGNVAYLPDGQGVLMNLKWVQ